ncbi:serine hydrolase domain-containing protein [Pontibacter ruber]|uniref:Serine hydrolase domain-containing protein n=1 Tax=Pontibacter ruber TaxID=1343895 RepID=A0ABW5D086_9BACT|nr:serine hydrolase domain-containing protein [Pontibacter ruber]
MTSTIQHALDSIMNSRYPDHQPGAALLVTSDGETLYSKGFGLAKLTYREPVSAATNFRMASVSKQFTAMCIHLLEQDGRLCYEDTLLHFFPEFNPVIGSKISLHQLLTHSSGLLDYEAFVDEKATKQVSDEHVLQIAAATTESYFEPGTAFRYSNTGYVLLALVVEQVSGLAFGTFLQQYIFEPLGMKNSILYKENLKIPERAMGYAYNAANAPYFSDQSTCSATKGDGCIYTSLQDYQLWHKALRQPGLFELQPLLDKVYFPIDKERNWFYGMGWFFSRRKNGSCEMYHTGNTCGFSNLVIRLPEQDKLIAYFSNIADNQHLLTDFLDVLSNFPEFSPKSDLVRQLGELTR